MELYLRRGNKLSDKDAEVEDLASLFHRTNDAVLYKLGNIEWVATKGRRGWRNKAKMDSLVWREFANRGSSLQEACAKNRANPPWL